MNRKQIMLELADERSAIQITELKEEIEHLKQGQIHFENLYAQECDKVNKLEQKLEKIQEIVAFDHELAKQVKEIMEDNNNDR